ncbi:MAG TPA: hydrolase [Pseudobacillus sp.]
MEEVKRIYYVDPASKEVLPTAEGEGNFRIEATDQEAAFIKRVFEEEYNAEIETFVRAHVPYLDYSYKEKNDHYDRALIAIYGLIYKFGDEEARRHIDGMGILDKYRLNEKKDF